MVIENCISHLITYMCSSVAIAYYTIMTTLHALNMLGEGGGGNMSPNKRPSENTDKPLLKMHNPGRLKKSSSTCTLSSSFRFVTGFNQESAPASGGKVQTGKIRLSDHTVMVKNVGIVCN